MICSGLNDKCDGCGKRLTAGVQRICKPRRPHEYRVTTVIPFKGETWTLGSVIASHRRQTERPYIMLIDTGANTRDSIERGSPETLGTLSRGGNTDWEMHSLNTLGARNGSEPVAMAMDVAMALCQTEFMLCTHNDVWLKHAGVVAELMGLCSATQPAVGYRITPRWYPRWEDDLGHTLTMLHMPTMRRIRASWNMQTYCENEGEPQLRLSPVGGRPDTEHGLNQSLRLGGFTPGAGVLFLGDERNFEPTDDDRIFHARSLTCGSGNAEYREIVMERIRRYIDDSGLYREG